MSASVFHIDAPLSITLIGGCHSIGHYIGREKGYVAVASDLLNREDVNHHFETVVFKKINRLAHYFDGEDVAQPDVLILQLGNYEFSPALRADIRKFRQRLLGKKKAASPAQKKQPSGAKEFPDFIPGRRYLFNQWIKHLVNMTIFYRYLNRRKWLLHIDRFFSSIKRRGIANVLVLTPTPHTNMVTNTHRKIGGELLRRKSVEFGFHFIDIHNLIERKYRGESIFIDEGHLKEEQLRFIGAIIHDYIVGYVEPSQVIDDIMISQ